MGFSDGHDLTLQLRFGDGLGRLFIAIAITWSTFLITGIGFLIVNRNLPFLRMRNLPLIISAVATLHVYWLLCFIAYGLNGYFPCDAEYWIMNIYLPLGIALFHASNTQLLNVADVQRRYMSSESVLQESRDLLSSRSGSRWSMYKAKHHGSSHRTLHCIAVGMLFQFVFALAAFLVSKKFHHGWGLTPYVEASEPTMRGECRQGWEWIFSIGWQFFWSWIYAPYLLWKVRRIYDIHGWRKQTMFCCIAGLPATPMWLVALYVPQMSKVNLYYIPPFWFVPSIFLIEAFMIFVPCWHVLQHFRQKKETLRIIDEWEKRNIGSSIDSISSGKRSSTRWSYSHSSGRPTISRQSHYHMYTSAALEKALQTNPIPLLEFAALKDFSGENISFLNHVRKWKEDWRLSRSSVVRLSSQIPQLREQQFLKALSIYLTFVSTQYSSFPINISHSHQKELDVLFEETAAKINTEPADITNAVAPFDDISLTHGNHETVLGKDEMSWTTSTTEHASSDSMNNETGSKTAAVVNVFKMKEIGAGLHDALPIPSTFGPGVFDHAVESVKYMVLTNTWPKFVDHGCASILEKSSFMDKFHEKMSGCGLSRSRNSSF